MCPQHARLPSHGFRSLDVPRRLIMSQPHRHNDVELNFVQSGSITYLLGGETVDFSADHLYVFWAAMPHQIVHATEDAAHRVLTIPLPDVLYMGLPSRFVGELLNGAAITDSDQDNAAFNRRQSTLWHRQLANGADDCVRIVRLEVEACLRRLSIASTASAVAPSPATTLLTAPGRLDHVNKMVALITARYRDPLTVDQIAGAAGLHPNYAMQLFRRHVNMTLVEYLTQFRVAHAQRLLLTTDCSTLEVGLACGFNSQSRFYAAFKSICGAAPAAYRQAVRMRGDLAEQQLVSLLSTLHSDDAAVHPVER